MSTAGHFEINGDCLVYRPVGIVSIQEATNLIGEAIRYTRGQGIPKLLMDITKLTGFESPNPAARYFIMREWAAASQGVVQVAFVAAAEMIDPHKFGVMVARNAGFDMNAFTAEAAAMAWLARPTRE